jgi:hypothetical protein
MKKLCHSTKQKYLNHSTLHGTWRVIPVHRILQLELPIHRILQLELPIQFLNFLLKYFVGERLISITYVFISFKQMLAKIQLVLIISIQ